MGLVQNRILVDTNIIIYHLNGDSTLETLLDEKEIFISFISEIELRNLKTITAQSGGIMETFLSYVTTIHSNDRICRYAAEIRRDKIVKTPDAIIAATSRFLAIPLVTADKSLMNVQGLNVIEYQPAKR